MPGKITCVDPVSTFIPGVTGGLGVPGVDGIDGISGVDGVDGFVVKQDDIDEYKRKLEQLMTDAPLLEKFSKKAKNESSKFEVLNIVHCCLKLFKKMDDENDKS